MMPLLLCYYAAQRIRYRQNGPKICMVKCMLKLTENSYYDKMISDKMMRPGDSIRSAKEEIQVTNFTEGKGSYAIFDDTGGFTETGLYLCQHQAER